GKRQRRSPQQVVAEMCAGLGVGSHSRAVIVRCAGNEAQTQRTQHRVLVLRFAGKGSRFCHGGPGEGSIFLRAATGWMGAEVSRFVFPTENNMADAGTIMIPS